jgi:hypothetical protein
MRIPINSDMIINENAVGESFHLVDEQMRWQSGPLSFRPESIWKPEFSWNEPLHIAIDLKSIHSVQSLVLYRNAELFDDVEGRVSIYYGKPFEWTPLVEGETIDRNEWQQVSFSPVKSQYFRLVIEGGKVNLGELFFFGTAVNDKRLAISETITDQKKNTNRTTFDEMLGINAFVDDPLGRLDYFGFVREYHNWRWVEQEGDPPYPDNVNHWNPGNSKWDFDSFYRNMYLSNIVVCPSIKENLKWLRRNHWEINTKPLLPDAVTTNPRSYIAHADHMFQYAARYGHTVVIDSLLKLAEGQPNNSGLGYLRYFENWNEQNIWWKGRAEYFTPYEYAAMSSADYDGHLQALGNTVGLKNADPTAKLVMSGLASLNLDYVKAMKFWADFHRNGSFPADVLNFHHYSRYQKGDKRYAISPEEDNLQTKLEFLVAYRDQYLPDHELWLTEFGYDTHPDSPQGVRSFGGFTNEEVQGIWLVRSVLAAAAAGIDRTSIYMLRDVKDNDASLYNTCGITSSKQSGWQPKPAWHFLKTLSRCLKGMEYVESLPSKHSDVRVYKFAQKLLLSNRPKSAYVVWSATSAGEKINNYQLALSSQEKYNALVDLSNDSIDSWQTLNLEPHNFSIEVSEKPVIVLTSNEEFDIADMLDEGGKQLILRPEMISYSSDNLSNTNPSLQNVGLVDEQTEVGNPIMNRGNKTTNNWKTIKIKSEEYPYSAYIDLGEEKFINTISIFDANNEGELSISVGRPYDWQQVAVDRLMQYNKWSHHIVNQETQMIRITKHSPASNIGEIVIYTK